MSGSTTTGERPCAAPLDAVDHVELDGDAGARGIKAVRVEDAYMNGHYPSFPIYPGVFVLESVVQTHRAACRARGAADPGSPIAVCALRLTAPVFPGDLLHVQTTAEEGDAGGAVRVNGRCHKDGRPAARVTIVFPGAGR